MDWIVVLIKWHGNLKMVKPWNWVGIGINLGLGMRGPDIRPGLDNRHLIIEGHRGLRRW